ncbi:PIN domain nuclease [Candidatus Poriferisodalis sp.]|uniref:PIN domain nuclease n=1 Tax=Candidatus Poriferisodalis sp. TaxID=3101277 RepID=UPI003B029A5E
MAVTEWLIDTSALVRLEAARDATEWSTRIQRGLVRISTVTRLELGYSARSAAEYQRQFARFPLNKMLAQDLTAAAEERAVEVQTLLVGQGHHRAPSVADLLLAAIAELEGLTILHVDKDFELIAELTGQPVERLAIEPSL